jgi:hypothetical protein
VISPGEQIMQTSSERQALPRLWPWLLLAGVLALWIDLGPFHRHNNSDSLVPVLVSLYRWTAFYWDQSRVGMLVPLLALPLRHPLDNLLFQAWLVLWATLALPFLLTRYTLRSPAWPLAGALAAATWVAFSSPVWLFVSSFGQLHYAMGLTLGLGGLLLVEAAAASPRLSWKRLATALLLMILAGWANTSTGIILIPLVAFTGLLRRPVLNRETALALAVVAAGSASCLAHRWLVPISFDPVGEGLQPVRDWPAAWGQLAARTWQEAGQAGWPGLLTLVIAAAVWPLLPALRRNTARALAAVLAVAGAAAVYGLFVGTTLWVKQNFFSARYWIPVVFFVHAALAILATAAPGAVWGLRSRVRAAAVLVLVLAVAATQGLPSRARARAEVDRIHQEGVTLTQRTAEVLHMRATHLVGNYWQVWASVFHANLVLHERGEDHTVWGVSFRSTPTQSFWRNMAPEDFRVAVLTNGRGPDPEADTFLSACFPPMEVVCRHESLWDLRARETVLLAGKPSSTTEPVVASFYGGFYPSLPGFRGCGGYGKLNLTNPSAAPRTVTLHLSLAACGSRPCRLRIDSPFFEDEVALTATPVAYSRLVTLPPGRHVLQFRCNGTPHPHSSSDMPLLFLVGGWSVDEGAPASGAGCP